MSAADASWFVSLEKAQSASTSPQCTRRYSSPARANSSEAVLRHGSVYVSAGLLVAAVAFHGFFVPKTVCLRLFLLCVLRSQNVWLLVRFRAGLPMGERER